MVRCALSLLDGALDWVRQRWKDLSDKQRQWLWFIALWLGGLGSVLLMSQVIRMMMGLD
jgi:hypothetical protein